MHPLLHRQLRKLGLGEDSPPDAEQWRVLVERISHTYVEADQDRYTLERSLMTSSLEMQNLNRGLQRSEANFKILVEQSPDCIFVRKESTIRYANPAMARLLGYQHPGELVGLDPLETFVLPADRDAIAEFRGGGGGPMGSIQGRLVRRDGAVIVVEGVIAPITFDDEPASLTIVTDITERLRRQGERERAQEALRLSEERYRSLFDASPLSVMLFDRESLRVLAVNDAAVQLYGYPREEFLTLRVPDLEVSEPTPELLRGMTDLREGITRPGSGELAWRGMRKHRKKDGTLLDVDITAHPLVLDGLPTMLAVGTDVTETRVLEQQLRQAQKMEAVGQLAGGVAHDFNNILAVILTCAELTGVELGEGHPASSELREIEAAVKRAAGLTRQLLTFSRQQPYQPRVLELNAVIEGMGLMLGRVIEEDVQMTTRLAPRLGPIEADLLHMEQVLLNLVVNARDAMPNGGRLSMETDNVDLGDAEARPAGVRPGRYVKLAVSDTGCGMDAATQTRVFEPFFTTKAVGKGTGLGLSMVFGIVKQSGGGITVFSEPGRGTTFTIYLPRVGAPSDSVRARAATIAPPARGIEQGTETVLVVEDEEQVRRVVTRLLEARGYTVLGAHSADAAFDVFRDRAADIDLVLTDIVMPEMDGRAMAALVGERHPRVRVLYMSGYTDHAAVKGDAFGSPDHFVQKPFTGRALALAVRRALDDPCKVGDVSPLPRQ